MSHEPLSADRPTEPGSDRSFGLVVASALSLLAFSPLLRGEAPHFWAVGFALVFGAAAFVAPRRLRRLNLLWHAFGLALHSVVNPVVMGVLFFGLFTPIALLFRFMRRDALGLSFDRAAASYWTMRDPTERADMRKQF